MGGERLHGRIGILLLVEQVFCDEEGVGGSFGEAAHEVGIPLGAEGDVDAHVEPVVDEGFLQVAADAVEHLELEGLRVDVALADEGFGGCDHLLVVCGDAVVDAARKELLGELDVVCVYVLLFREGEVRRFLVGAFAEADADAVAGQGADIVLAAIEIGLDDDADMSAIGGDGVQAADHIDGGLSVSAALHVDADESVGGDGVLDEAGYDLLGQAGIEVHAHLGELYADIGVQVTGLDGVEQAMVDVGGVAGLFGGRDIFAQAVEGRSDAGTLQGFGGAEDLVESHAGDEAGGHLPAHGRPFGEASQGCIAGKGDKRGAQDGHNFLENGEPSIFA